MVLGNLSFLFFFFWLTDTSRTLLYAIENSLWEYDVISFLNEGTTLGARRSPVVKKFILPCLLLGEAGTLGGGGQYWGGAGSSEASVEQEVRRGPGGGAASEPELPGGKYLLKTSVGGCFFLMLSWEETKATSFTGHNQSPMPVLVHGPGAIVHSSEPQFPHLHAEGNSPSLSPASWRAVTTIQALSVRWRLLAPLKGKEGKPPSYGARATWCQEASPSSFGADFPCGDCGAVLGRL